jgi:hypothetical protein
MTTNERREAKVRLQSAIDQWMNETQESDAPFDCWIGEETVTLMTDAAFAVIEAVDDVHVYLRREGLLEDAG